MKLNQVENLLAYSTVLLRLIPNLHKLQWRDVDMDYLAPSKTLTLARERGIGIVRFGNSELRALAGLSIPTQDYSPDLTRRLRTLLINYHSKEVKSRFILCLPLNHTLKLGHSFKTKSPEYQLNIRKNWRLTPRLAQLPFLRKNVTYGNPFCFRLKDIEEDEVALVGEEMDLLFEGNNIIYVGPEHGKNKKFNDFFEPEEYISIPEKNAFFEYDSIRNKVIAKAEGMRNPLILIVAGVTATVLSTELNELGYRCVDFGQHFRHKRELSLRRVRSR